MTIDGEMVAEVILRVRVRATTAEERAEWLTDLEASSDVNIASFGTFAHADELREQLGIDYEGDPEQLENRRT
jgi:hypothetical protein